MSDPRPTPEQIATYLGTLPDAQMEALVGNLEDAQKNRIATALASGLPNERKNALVTALFGGLPNAEKNTLATQLNRNRNEVMVALINSHNPYTDNTGDQVSIFVGNPNPDNHDDDNINQIEMEVDGPYAMPMEVSFKGSPQKVNKMLRIKYRYRARNLDLPDRPLLQPRHWVTAYLLIGFEDGGA